MNLVVGDIETSENNVNMLSVLEASFVIYDERFKELESFHESARIRPTCVPSLGACLTTGIRTDKLVGANNSSFELATKIHNTLSKWGSYCTIGQNFIAFDNEALVRMFHKSLIPDIWLLKKLPKKMMDTLFLARASKLIDNKSLNCEVSPKGSDLFKLESLCKMNGIPHENSHSSAGDVHATALLAKLIKERAPKLWEQGLKIAHKTDAKKFIERNKIISHVAYFYGKARWYGLKFCFYNNFDYARLWDLRANPEDYLKLNYQDLKKEISKTPKVIRTVKPSKFDICMDYSYAFSSEPYSKIGEPELRRRATILDSNPEFIELIRTIDNDEIEEKQTMDQRELIPEFRLYKDGFASKKDEETMKLFHKMEWKDRVKLFDRWENKKYAWFNKVLLFEERPELLSKPVFNEVRDEFSRRLHTTEDVNWHTFPKFSKELADYGTKFEKEKDEKKLQLLNEYDSYVTEMEKKFPKP
mgnify:FL=1